MFKKSLISVLLMTTPAISADMVHETQYEPAPQYEAEVQPIRWTGLRLGIHAGITHTSADANLGDTAGDLINLDVYNGLFPDLISADNNSFAGGIDAGYDYQIGNVVLGVAGDLTFSNIDVTNTFARVDPNPNPPFTGVNTNTAYMTKVDYLATARLRMGYAFDRTMIYGTAGVATAEVENRFDLEIPELAYTSPNWAEKNRLTGLVLGIGVEHQITDNWRFSLELQHVDLGDVTVNAVDPTNFPGQEINYTFDNKLMLARFGLAYAF
ncbi:outer membrane protein [Pseudahrensia aquimaris]|uniref:Outer membrane protein n=1 Tax=Pseudahrensia aquimaris TaxID=744461 RepID=A0ABW3FHS1_9HYPH